MKLQKDIFLLLFTMLRNELTEAKRIRKRMTTDCFRGVSQNSFTTAITLLAIKIPGACGKQNCIYRERFSLRNHRETRWRRRRRRRSWHLKVFRCQQTKKKKKEKLFSNSAISCIIYAIISMIMSLWGINK